MQKPALFLVAFALITLFFVLSGCIEDDPKPEPEPLLACSDLNGIICPPTKRCGGELKEAADTFDCCLGECEWKEENVLMDMWASCESDLNCIKVDKNDCSCNLLTINSGFEEEWKSYLSEKPVDGNCDSCSPNITSFAKPKCVENKCVLDLNDASACSDQRFRSDYELCYYLFALQNNDTSLCYNIVEEHPEASVGKPSCLQALGVELDIVYYQGVACEFDPWDIEFRDLDGPEAIKQYYKKLHGIEIVASFVNVRTATPAICNIPSGLEYGAVIHKEDKEKMIELGWEEKSAYE